MQLSKPPRKYKAWQTLTLGNAIAAILETVGTLQLDKPTLQRLQTDLLAMEDEINHREDALIVFPLLKKWLPDSIKEGNIKQNDE